MINANDIRAFCVPTEAPTGKPSLRLEKSHYGLGDTVRGNCSSPISTPASNITWLVNNKKVRLHINCVLLAAYQRPLLLNRIKVSYCNQANYPARAGWEYFLSFPAYLYLYLLIKSVQISRYRD